MKTFFIILAVLAGFYILFLALVYFFQEKMIFLPQTLAKDHIFQFDQPFEERYVEMKDGKILHALLFKAENSKGVVLFLHGNAGSLAGWGSVAETFTTLNYDAFIPDFRGYGKSEGAIKSESQVHQDMQSLYNNLKKEYSENRIIVLGHSIGSGMAANLAANNDPRLLILQAPYYSLPDLAENTPPLNIFPQFLFKYKFETGKKLRETKVPVVVIHGEEDEVIYYGSSLKLEEKFKPGDTLITLDKYGHNDFLTSERYKIEMEKVLDKL